MSKSRIEELSELGQSIWLDYISRSLLKSGKLQGLIDAGLRGLTSNPTIFDQAISQSTDYDNEISDLAGAGKSVFQIYDDLTIADIQAAADLFQGVYEKTHRNDGYVSLEIDPRLAHQTAESIQEGKRLFAKVGRPNVMIKVPATPEGFPVIEELIASGINVNVTLIFSLEQYRRTAEAFLNGLNRLSESGGDLKTVRSVASVFVSRIDTTVDKLLEERIAQEADAGRKKELQSLLGKAAVANSKIIFVTFKEIFAQEDQALVAKGGEVQRVLWGSTGTKNPNYSDVKYVTDLIGRPTVNTLPEKTLQAFLAHGAVKETLSEYADEEARAVIAGLKGFDIDIDQICVQLLTEGVAAFVKSFEQLLSSIENKASEVAGST